MTEVKPFIKCIDYWENRIPRRKLAAYKELINAGMIREHHVLVNQRTGATVVAYSSTVPHEWILEELKKISEGK